MKSYDEIAENVLSRRDEIVNKKRERRKKVMRIASPMAVLCLAVLIGIGVSQADFLRDEPQSLEDALYPGIPDYTHEGDEVAYEAVPEWGTYPAIWNEIYEEGGGIKKDIVEYPYATENPQGNTLVEGTTYAESIRLSDPIPGAEVDSEAAESVAMIEIPPYEGSNRNDFCKIFAVVNSITGKASAAKKFYDPALYRSEKRTSEQMAEYIGIDIEYIESNLPSDMNFVSNDHEVIYNSDGTLEFDIAHFAFENSEGGRVTIHASKLMQPYDCIYILNDEKYTRIDTANGQLEILAGGMEYDEESGWFELFFADFEYEGIYYRLEFENIYKNKIIDAVFKMIIK